MPADQSADVDLRGVARPSGRLVRWQKKFNSNTEALAGLRHTSGGLKVQMLGGLNVPNPKCESYGCASANTTRGIGPTKKQKKTS